MKTKPFLIIEPSEMNFTEITSAGTNYVSRLYVHFSIISKFQAFCLVNSLRTTEGCSYRFYKNNDRTYSGMPLHLTRILENNTQAVGNLDA